MAMDPELQARVEAAWEDATLGFAAKLEILRIDIRTMLRVLLHESAGPDCAVCGMPLIPAGQLEAGMCWLCPTPWCPFWLQQQSSL